MNEKNNSFIAIDIMRAIAALGVFAYHQHIGSTVAKYSGLNFIELTDNFGAAYAVPLFFLISGYCIHFSNLKYIKIRQALPLKEYYLRRFLRIYPPYLIALSFTVAVNYFTYKHVPTPKDIAVHIFVLQGFSGGYFNTINVVLWTITIEMAFYIIYPIFYYIRLKYSVKRAMVFVFFISITSILYFSLKPVITLPGYYFVLNLWFAWCWGAYLADRSVYKSTGNSFILVNALIIILFIALKSFPNKFSIITYQVNIIVWTIPLLFILSKEHWLKSRINIVTRVLGCIGLSSYSLYLLHEPLITLKNYLAHRFLPQNLQLLGEGIGIIVIPIITWYSFKYLEMPFTVRKKIAVEQNA